MNRLSILAAVIVTTLSALPGAVADEFWRKGLVEDEIKRHVIKECDLYTHYKKNMFELRGKRHVIKECDLYTHYKKNMFEFRRWRLTVFCTKSASIDIRNKLHSWGKSTR